MTEEHTRIKDYIQTMTEKEWEEFFEHLNFHEEILKEAENESYSEYLEVKNQDHRNKKYREAKEKYIYMNGRLCLFSEMMQWLSGNFTPLF